MRSTANIIGAIKDCEPVEYEELRLAVLVLDSLLTFKQKHLIRLLKGGYGAELTEKMEYPDAHKDLGISKTEWNALRMDPEKYLGKSHIPGTPEFESHYKISKKILEKALAEGKEDEADD